MIKQLGYFLPETEIALVNDPKANPMVFDITLEQLVAQTLSVSPEEYQKPPLDFKDKYLRIE